MPQPEPATTPAAADRGCDAPLVWRSGYQFAGRLEPPQGALPQDETPLFAADRVFAAQHGGLITRAFVSTLPQDPAVPVVIDSSLVWLVPGLAHGFELPSGGRQAHGRSPLRFAHEPFPGARQGVRAAANRNRAATYRWCVLGLDCTTEFAVGEVVCADAAEAMAFWLPDDDTGAREAGIARRLAAGELGLRPLACGDIAAFGWGCLRRARPAAASGFQLILRASIDDPRPVVNGRRNLAML